MNKTFERFVGKDCVITTMNGTITGIVESIEDNWLVVKTGESTASALDMVSVDYISRIREHPLNRRGKKKSFLWDTM